MADKSEDVVDSDKMSNKSKEAFNKIIANLTKSSDTKQLLIGVGSGWVTGILTLKGARTAAFAVGGGIIIMQVAQNQGLVKIDWGKIKAKADKVKEEKGINRVTPNILAKVKKFARCNSVFAAGFIGGFLIGVAS
ncbi:PREDICTED: FUN14 domain-containing protein 1-like [Nicrophorus vespilloides]|uniref:FUN14 domain-containing protein 1-like n=1 Tax=Nicrophorus vespilloides TaxID=110193 RepID=A0ABM1N9G8_NICVS|nr:PREDICTED: FUN14 domain-containing protein 1-like [Nicrophorus vespilloides]